MIFNVKIEDTHNMGMSQTGYHPCFTQEAFNIVIFCTSFQSFIIALFPVALSKDHDFLVSRVSETFLYAAHLLIPSNEGFETTHPFMNLQLSLG
ncbi:MAG TPA: hypothetical protein VEL72_08555 [Ktedonobacteraceae bacterium]|nr:hypothetical protein [Ktedonobacteraceae bacterium]